MAPRSLAPIGFLAVLGLAATATAIDYGQFRSTQETLQAKVISKQRLCEMVADTEDRTDASGHTETVQTGSHEECTNLIHTDRETFQNDGVIWAGLYNANAMQGRIVAGETYTFRVYGRGNENLGVYRKVIKVAKIIPGDGQFGGGGSANW